MQKLSQLIHTLFIGQQAQSAATIKTCNIDAAGVVTVAAGGVDLVVTTALGGAASGEFAAEKVWGAVWNDIADFQLVCDEIVFGKCYYDTFDGAKICNQRCQKSAIGIASDTFGFAVGQGRYPSQQQVPIAVSGWVLAYVDKTYEPGTPLTNNEEGILSEMTTEEKLKFPERLLAIYKKPEFDTIFGTEKKKVDVNGRHWVKVK